MRVLDQYKELDIESLPYEQRLDLEKELLRMMARTRPDKVRARYLLHKHGSTC